MSQDFETNEPSNHLDDTNPTGTMPKVYAGPNNQHSGPPRWLFGVAALLLIVMVGGGILLVIGSGGGDDEPTDGEDAIAQGETEIPVTNVPPTDLPATDVPTVATQPTTPPAEDTVFQPLDASLAQQLLAQPLTDVDTNADPVRVKRTLFEPFTIIPDRPRNEMIEYTVAQGDTVEAIANRFGLEPESIAWSNDRSKIQVLRPGDVLNIPPVDGVFIYTFGSSRTVADWAAEYDVTDPFVVLDSPFNPQLRGLSPDSVPASGTPIFIPDGIAEEVVWVAEIEIVEGTSSNGGTTTGPPRVVFQNGQQGSCSPQEAVGGSFWANPLNAGSYRITRGYTSFHSGIDLAAPVGTPVKAANGGRVVFSGWNSFGYGYMIAVVHGPTMTVYAHLSEYYTNCGQDVSTGQIIGAVGSSGNSSGPHLHFEIRSRAGNTYAPQDPSFTIGF